MVDQTSRKKIKKHWRDLSLSMGWDVKQSEVVLRHIIDEYSKQNRYYHTEQHIANLLELYQEIILKEHNFKDHKVALLAIFFHDIIYEVKLGASVSNEQKSAAVAGELLETLGVAPNAIEDVKRYILSTANHKDTGLADVNLFIDLDMSILGAEASAYDLYVDQIRREYEPVYGHEAYTEGRKHFLSNILKNVSQGKTIFLTKVFVTTYEQQARENINRELKKMEGTSVATL